MLQTKKILSFLFIISILFVLISCDTDEGDITPPSPPTNLKVYTGDGEIHITWQRSPENDVVGYIIWACETYAGKYEEIGRTSDNHFVDGNLKNGQKYYYAVTAYDRDGNESVMSNDNIYGITRPEGKNEVIKDYIKFPNVGGFSFITYTRIPFESDSCDFFFENYEGKFSINVWQDAELQDMGETKDIYEIEVAPTQGWIPLGEGNNVKFAEAIVGHTYIVMTFDGFYGKVRINALTGETMIFDWVFQTLKGETLLKRNAKRKINKTNKVVIKKNRK